MEEKEEWSDRDNEERRVRKMRENTRKMGDATRKKKEEMNRTDQEEEWKTY